VLDPWRRVVALAGVAAEVVPAEGGGQHGTKIETPGCPVERS